MDSKVYCGRCCRLNNGRCSLFDGKLEKAIPVCRKAGWREVLVVEPVSILDSYPVGQIADYMECKDKGVMWTPWDR